MSYQEVFQPKRKTDEISLKLYLSVLLSSCPDSCCCPLKNADVLTSTLKEVKNRGLKKII